MTKINTDLKVLLFDIECSMAKFYGYGLFDQNIPIQHIIEHPRMIAFSAKWYGKKGVKFFSEYHQSRQEMLDEMHALLDEADVVVGFNSRGFDIKWVNSEFAVEGMKPPSPYKQIDLMVEAKRNFRFISRKLDYLADRLLDDKKLDYNMAKMWAKVDNPNTSEADRKREWDAMARYAKKDTALLEPLLEELLPWIRMPHPVSSGPDSCHNCGGTHLQKRGTIKTLYSEYDRLSCVDCGKWLRGTTRQGVTNVRGI